MESSKLVHPNDIHIYCIWPNLLTYCWANIVQDRAENPSDSRPLRRKWNEPINSRTTQGQVNHNRAGNGISAECVHCGSLNMMTSVMDDHFHAVHKLSDVMNALLCHTTLNSIIHCGEWTGLISKCTVFKILTTKCINCLAVESQYPGPGCIILNISGRPNEGPLMNGETSSFLTYYY